MLDDAGLPVEFWCKATECQAITRSLIRRGPVLIETLKDKSGKPNKRVEWQISLYKA